MQSGLPPIRPVDGVDGAAGVDPVRGRATGANAESIEAIEGLDHPRVWTVASPRSAVDERQSGAETPVVWGLSAEERVRRALGRETQTPVDDSGAELLVAANLILDEKVLLALACRPGTLLLDEGGQPAAACVTPAQRERVARWIQERTSPGDLSGFELRSPGELIDTYDPLLRKAATPVAVRVTSDNVDEIEARLFRASYKGVTDFVTKWIWPRPARAVTRSLAQLGVSPNAVTLWSWALVVVATLLFARGAYGWGLVAGWGMTFLDTVDGKLARVTLTSSRLGNVLDHGLDIIHPPFWYAAWAIGFQPAPTWWTVAAWWVIGGYVAGRLLEGAFMWAFRIETHSWRPLDSWFRTITARRNPNLVLLSGAVLMGRPDLGFAAVALWTALSLAFHSVRLVQATLWRVRGRRVEAWYTAGRATASLFVIGLILALGAPARASGPDLSGAGPVDTTPSGSVASPSEVPAPSPPAVVHGATRPPAGIEATPLRGGSASQSWDFAFVFQSGHELFVRFLITNVGIGDNNAAAVWHLFTPDGGRFLFKNGRRASGWSLEDEAQTLRVGASVLSLKGPQQSLEIQKKKVRIALRFSLPNQFLHRIEEADHRIDVASLRMPVEASLWSREGVPTTVVTHGVGSSTRSEAKSGDAALRRAEYIGLDAKHPWYITEVLTSAGERRSWALWLEGEELRVAERSTTCGSRGEKSYPEPRGATAQRGDEGIRIEVDPPFLRYDPLDSLPRVLRLMLSSRPMRLWSRVRSVHQHPAGDFETAGISRVSFGDTVPKQVLRSALMRGGECEPDSAS